MNPRRWMMFVDGENVVCRGQDVAKALGFQLQEGSHYKRDVFLWFPKLPPTLVFTQPAYGAQLEKWAIRSHYYTSMTGSHEGVDETKMAIRDVGFHPVVFKKDKGSRNVKGVDITLTKDMLAHAYDDNYDVAVLLTGDGDFVPVIEEVKRMGKAVYVAFFEHEAAGLSKDLRLASDKFFRLTDVLKEVWKNKSTPGAAKEDVISD